MQYTNVLGTVGESGSLSAEGDCHQGNHGPAVNIALMLHYLVTGKDYHSLEWVFHVPHNTISGIVLEVCKAIIDEYATELFKTLTKLWMAST